jgi:hypothetical protein
MRLTKGLKQAYDMQDVAYDTAMALRKKVSDPETGNVNVNVIDKDTANAIATLIKAWDTAQDRVRIHRGRPLPGVLKPESRKASKPASALLDIARDASPASEPEGQQSQQAA